MFATASEIGTTRTRCAELRPIQACEWLGDKEAVVRTAKYCTDRVGSGLEGWMCIG